MTGSEKGKAQTVRDLLIELSPLIEDLTSRVCPDCGDVCCKQKRCIPDSVDIRYRNALGAEVPTPDPSRFPDGPCQFMDSRGCDTPRWLRPWRCTWYFCDPLLDAMQKGPRKKMRRISSLIQQIVDIRSNWQ